MVGDKLMEVDWRRTFYLNMIAHTSFTVTVAICRYSSLSSQYTLCLFFVKNKNKNGHSVPLCTSSSICFWCYCLHLLLFFRRKGLLHSVTALELKKCSSLPLELFERLVWCLMILMFSSQSAGSPILYCSWGGFGEGDSLLYFLYQLTPKLNCWICFL